MEAVKALTLHQPWASLIALGVKTIETRSWKTDYRGPLVIHAAGRRPTEPVVGDFELVEYPKVREFFVIGPLSPRLRSLPLGAVVATCTLVDVVPIVHGHKPIVSYPPRYVTVSNGIANVTLGQHDGDRSAESLRDLTDQAPYGDFSPGRYAWLLDDIQPVDPPVPARGRQGLWEWTP